MGEKLTSRQQAQLQWLSTLQPKFERMVKLIELLSINQAGEVELRGLSRLLDSLKAQAGALGITALADSFGYMGTLLRRAGGHQMKVRGLRELLAGAKINFEGAVREASISERKDAEDEDEEVTPP